jgi:PAS domain S-box-containing protein
VSVLLAIALRLAQAVSQTARIEERATLDLALQSTTDGLWEWDLVTGEVTRSSQLWERLGYAGGDGHRRMSDWLALVHPQDRVRVEARLTDHLESRAEAFDAQYRVRSAAGRWHDFIDRGRVVLRSPTGQPLRVLGMFADVTDRRHAEESLRQAETMSTMGRLAARIAHEINNPLAGIQSAFLLIKDAIPLTHPHIKYVGAIEREIQRISQVTRQLYETYRPETESSTHAPVQTVVGDAVAFLEQVNRNTGVSISVELGGIAAVVRLSDSLLRQCIYNLAQNAIEASPPGSRVLVSGSIDGGDFVLRVRDHGPGVPPDLRESIFDPFISTKPSQLSTGGMGMGLSLVRRAVDAAGGSIEVIDAAGGGAEFVARIPLAEPTVHGVTA